MSNYKRNNKKRNTRAGAGKDTRDSKFKGVEKFRNDRADSSNDPSWYGMDPALLRDSSSIPYSWAVGTPINRNNPAFVTANLNQYYAVPGIATMYIHPSVGYSDGPASPINVAAANLYANLRKVNSGYSNYNAPDLMIYLLTLDQMYSFINFAQRAYGLTRLYAQKNRYLPQGILEANLINTADAQANLANFRYRLNTLINKVASFSVPAFLPIFKRHAFMYSQVYIEGASMKDQLYQFVPYAFWKFTLDEETSAGKLVSTPWWRDGLYSLDELMDFGESLIAPIFTNEDFNIMSGDIRKAYGEDVIKLAPVDTDYMCVPAYDVAVLEQFKNAIVPTIDTNGITYGGLDIEQDPADVHTLIHKPKLNYSKTDAGTRAVALAAQALCQDKMITTKAPEPTPELTMENTRLCAIGMDLYVSDNTNVIEIHGGSDLPMYCRIQQAEVNASGVVTGYDNAGNITYDAATHVNMSEDDWVHVFRNIGKRLNFEFLPECCRTLWRAGSTEGSVNIAYTNPEFQVDNYAVINRGTLDRMHEAALLSLFHVPPVSRA